MADAPGATGVGRAEAMRIFALEAPLNVLVTDLEMRLIAASPTFCQSMGQSVEQLVGRTVEDLFPGSQDGLDELVAALAAGESQHALTRPTNLPDGTVRWFEVKGSYWRDDAGEVAGYFITNLDVTAAREAEAARREMEVLLRAVIDNIPATISVQEEDSERFVLVNARVSETFGLATAEMIGRTPHEISPSAVTSEVRREIAKLRRDGGILVTEHDISRGPNQGRTLRLKTLMFEDGQGRKRVLSIGEDVTDLLRATHALEAAVADAEAANAAKSRFLANVSHEIRTPLNGVLGMAQAMANDPLPEVQRERLHVVRQSGETLLSLLNDLLDLAKIEAGKVELESLEFDVVEAVRSACAPFQVMADKNGVTLDLRLDAERDLRRGDPTRLRQVVANLVSNAVKFTTRGRVEVEVRLQPDALSISVRDTGMGIAPESLAAIFDKFSQADASTTRRFGGTGLGLAICRDLVDLMGGCIRVESEPGRGSCFAFDLPLPRIATASPAAEPIQSTGIRPMELRVLAAEDNKVNRLVLKTLLEQSGVSLTLVENGLEAVAAWAREPWDMILMDVQMPILDGVAATGEIRAREAAEGRARTPIIALTANAMSHHAAEYAACGMDGVVSKPIQIQELLRTMDGVLCAPEDEGRDDLRSAG